MIRTERVVLDDDPTGTQTVSDVPIVLRPSIDSLASAGEARTLWILTNTRAMDEDRAVRTVRNVVGLVGAALGNRVQLLLRGDSTLRGHVLAEVDAAGGRETVCLFVPALIELGRVTIGGVHYIDVNGQRVPVGETEYARDHAFGYRSSNLLDWVAEKGSHRPAIGVPLNHLRRSGDKTLERALRDSAPGTFVVPDAETYDDLAMIASALHSAEASGRHVVVRAAASFASVWTGLQSQTVRPEPAKGNILVVCGSHTTGATAQLTALGITTGVAPVYIEPHDLATEDDRALVAKRLRTVIASAGLGILATPREVMPEHRNLAAGERFMDALIDIAARVLGPDTTLITKGGITSARIARDAVGADTGWVEGAILPGIPVWRLRSGGVTRTQAVVPGNVGDEAALTTVFHILNGE